MCTSALLGLAIGVSAGAGASFALGSQPVPGAAAANAAQAAKAASAAKAAAVVASNSQLAKAIFTPVVNAALVAQQKSAMAQAQGAPQSVVNADIKTAITALNQAANTLAVVSPLMTRTQLNMAIVSLNYAAGTLDPFSIATGR